MEQVLNGEWFVPKLPGKKLPGVLKIEEAKIELTLYSLTDFEGKEVTRNNNEIDLYTVILGDCFGKKITLLNSKFQGSDKISYTLDTFTVSPKLVFAGAHFFSAHNIKLTRLFCSFPYLSAWMDSQEFYFKDFENGLIKDQYSKYFRKVTIEINDNFHIDIIRLLRLNEFKERNGRTYTVDHTVEIHSKTGSSFIEFEKKAFELKRIIEIAINEPIEIDFDFAKSANPAHKGIRLFGIRKKRIPKLSNDYRSPAFLLFSYKGLGEDKFKVVLENWFKTLNSHGVIYDIYLDTMKWFQGTEAQLTSVMFNNRILNVIQALESFHTIEHEGEDETKETFKKQFKLILEKLEPADKKWLKKRTFPSSKNLKQRLLELLHDFDSVFQDIFKTDEVENKFVDMLCEIRNSLSHGRHKDTDMILNVRDHYTLSRLLLISCILSKLGFNKQEIYEILERSSEFGRDMRWFKEHDLSTDNGEF